MQKIKPSCNPDGWPAGRPMKTKEVKLDSSFFEYDTFKVEKSNEHNFNIYTGREDDKHFIYTPYISLFNFDNYKEAQEMCDKLNRIADKYHENR